MQLAFIPVMVPYDIWIWVSLPINSMGQMNGISRVDLRDFRIEDLRHLGHNIGEGKAYLCQVMLESTRIVEEIPVQFIL